MSRSLGVLALLLFVDLGAGIGADSDYGQTKTLCGYGGSRENCVPIDGSTAGASPVDYLAPFAMSSSDCFLTDTTYTGLSGISATTHCKYLKHYGNGVLTFSTGGLYQYTDSQSSRHQYQRGDTNYEVGGGGGIGEGHSQGGSWLGDGAMTYDYYVLRQRKQSLAGAPGMGNNGPGGGNFGNGQGGNNGAHFDWYELKDGIYTFGYYDCDRIVQGGAIDDYQYHYFCSNQVDLYSGCVAKCGSNMADYTSFNYTSALFGEVEDTSTSQIFS